MLRRRREHIFIVTSDEEFEVEMKEEGKGVTIVVGPREPTGEDLLSFKTLVRNSKARLLVIDGDLDTSYLGWIAGFAYGKNVPVVVIGEAPKILERATMGVYPTREAFLEDLPRILDYLER